MKLQDPTIPYSTVIARRRAARAGTDGERFRLGSQCFTAPPAGNRTAVVAVSARALQADRVEDALSYVGLVGGILADLGFEVVAVASVADDGPAPALVAWITGGETSPDEAAQLGAIGTRGLAIGSGAHPPGWGVVDPDDHDDDLDLVAAVVAEARSVTDDLAAIGRPVTGRDPSTASSTVQSGTERYGMVRQGQTPSRNPSSRAQSGTERDGLNRRSEGS